MKNLKLKKLKLDTNCLLQRNQLKSVFGGYGYDTESQWPEKVDVFRQPLPL